MALKLKILIGSTRPGRKGPIVADWVDSVAQKHDAFDAEIVDLARLELPLLDEAGHPARKDYQKGHTQRWSAIVDDADAFVFVAPEYDYFVPASIVNAVQVLLKEWGYKPAAVVSYGGVSGGLRAAQELRTLISNVGMVPLKETVPLPFFWNHIDDDGRFVPNDPMKQGLDGMLDELAKWGTALRPMRGQAA